MRSLVALLLSCLLGCSAVRDRDRMQLPAAGSAATDEDARLDRPTTGGGGGGTPGAVMLPAAGSDAPAAPDPSPPPEVADAAVAMDAAAVPRPVPTPRIPAISEPCPVLATGEVTLLGKQVRLWVGARRDDVAGAIHLYWHGTGSPAEEAELALGDNLGRITDEGGIVASFSETLGVGESTSTDIWKTGDFVQADVIVACAVEQLNIDTRRIYSSGCLAGGFHAGAMAYARSSYLAGVLTEGGGAAVLGTLEEPAHVPSVLTMHGGDSGLLVDTAMTSRTFGQDIARHGGLVVNCNHGLGQCAGLGADFAELREAKWQFMQDHPFGASADADPYAAGLPDAFPEYCEALH